MELKEGMYIRYQGEIDQIIDVVIDENNSKLNRVYTNFAVVDFDKIENASFDLIDLIKPGDIVNGHKVLQIYKKNILKIRFFEKYLECRSYKSSQPFNLYEKDIKNIVTKEQFEASKYTVERDE